jgi:hypothetical protein
MDPKSLSYMADHLSFSLLTIFSLLFELAFTRGLLYLLSCITWVVSVSFSRFHYFRLTTVVINILNDHQYIKLVQ